MRIKWPKMELVSRSSAGNALYLSMIDAPNRINNLAPALARFTSKASTIGEVGVEVGVEDKFGIIEEDKWTNCLEEDQEELFMGIQKLCLIKSPEFHHRNCRRGLITCILKYS